ncbi:MAG: ABC transporter substrate-binding protein [Desulfovibrio sp.]|jgi:branched-chain amino acid transport system substrate-binding protein|nr:ABC transporter substrate-binding protein [Desulfovibrio sp.]
MNRRTFLKTGLAAASLLTAPPLLRRALAADPVTFYGLKSMSGAYASYGEFAEKGSKLAVDDYGLLLGEKPRYVTIDTEGNPGRTVRKVQEAVQQQNARFFGGCTLSSTALAVGKEINKVGGVFMTPAGADEITASECNKATFRWTVPTYGAIQETVRPLFASNPKAKRWYSITPQYVFGEALLTAAKNLFAELGIEHVGNSYHSTQEQEYSGYLTNAAAANPDVLLILGFGGNGASCLRQAANFGMKSKMTILLAWTQGLDWFQSLGPDLLEGVYLGAQYWHQVDAPVNNALVKRTREVYGINPNYPLAGDYIITKIIFDAAAKAGTADGAAVIKAMEGMRYEGPTGPEMIRAQDHQVIKDYYLLRGKAKAAMKDRDDLATVVSSGKSFPEGDQILCKMS